MISSWFFRTSFRFFQNPDLIRGSQDLPLQAPDELLWPQASLNLQFGILLIGSSFRLGMLSGIGIGTPLI